MAQTLRSLLPRSATQDHDLDKAWGGIPQPTSLEPITGNTNGWDAKPRLFDYDGGPRQFFTRGALARALNRQIVTIRGLEHRGVFCTPTVKSARGVWLYTRNQIEDLITLAIEEGVLDPRFHRPFSRHFVDEAHLILSRQPEKAG
jgi:hypothetical protein